MKWFIKEEKPKHKYFVKDENDPITFGKFKGLSLAQLNQAEATRNWFQWASREGLFGVEDFWSSETRVIYWEIMARCAETYHGEKYEVDYCELDMCGLDMQDFF